MSASVLPLVVGGRLLGALLWPLAHPFTVTRWWVSAHATPNRRVAYVAAVTCGAAALSVPFMNRYWLDSEWFSNPTLLIIALAVYICAYVGAEMTTSSNVYTIET